MKIERDADVSGADDSDIGEKFVEKMRRRMADNLQADTLVAKERILEKRLKVKKRIRREAGEEVDGGREPEGEEVGMMLASGSASDQEDEVASEQGKKNKNSAAAGSGSGSDDDDESIEHIPLKKRQKTGVEQTGSIKLSSEAKALKLLASKSFF